MSPRTPESERDLFARDVFKDLSDSPKTLHPKYFYDAIGSELFEEITKQPEYYPTRTEAAILRENAGAIGELMGRDVNLVELGSGSSTKTTILLESFLESQDELHYVPIDISPTILSQTAESLDARYPELGVTPIASRYEPGLEKASTLVAEDERVPDHMLVLFLGSSIGNMRIEEANDFLRGIRAQLEPKDALLIGFDLQKDPAVLTAAYNDAAGVTAKFNLNLLARINRELDGTFDLENFAHLAFYDEERGRVEMHLQSKGQQTVAIGACHAEFSFEKLETIHTENSYKYTRDIIRTIAGETGFTVEHIFTDPKDWFALALFEPK